MPLVRMRGQFDVQLGAGQVPPPVPPPVVEVRRLRIWGDPILVKEADLSTAIVNTSNFQAIGLYNKETGWGGVSNFLRIPHGDMLGVEAMQIPDDYTAHEKMRWMCNDYRGKIYMWDDRSTNWESDPLRWGTIGLGGNYVQIDGYETFTNFYLPKNTFYASVRMARLVGFRKSDWGRPLNELVAQGLVHRCYCAYRTPKEDTFGDSPRGIVYNPFWSPLDWEFTGAKKPSAFYVPEHWLV